MDGFKVSYDILTASQVECLIQPQVFYSIFILFYLFIFILFILFILFIYFFISLFFILIHLFIFIHIFSLSSPPSFPPSFYLTTKKKQNKYSILYSGSFRQNEVRVKYKGGSFELKSDCLEGFFFIFYFYYFIYFYYFYFI